MATKLLSGSTNGKVILVTGTATGSSVLVHKSIPGTTHLDLVTLYATNIHSEDVVLTLEWGEAGSATKKVAVTLGELAGPIKVCENLPINNNLSITAFAGTADVVSVQGFVNRVDL